MLHRLRPLKRSIVVLVCAALPLVLAGASLASGTPTKKPHRPSIRHSAKRVAGIAPKPKADATTILVRFMQPATAAGKVRAAGDTPVRVVAGGVELVRLQRGESVAAKVRQYDRRSDVAYAEPNYVLRAAALPAPTDTFYASQQLGLQRIHPLEGWGIFPGAYPPVAPTPTIAIVDSGIDFAHPDLTGRAAPNNANCVTGACVAEPSPSDDSGSSHGTEVAGIVGASTNNGTTGIAGVAYASPLMSVKVLNAGDSGTFAAAAAGITWAADHGAKVINVSFGGTGFSATLCNAVTTATAEGAVVVAAAGNSADFAKNGSAVPFYPAACPGAVGVAATFNNDASPVFSNFGFPDVFLSAPGVNEISTLNASPDYSQANLTGTSFAAPFVSGAAALLLGQYPSRTVADVKRVLARTAFKAGTPTFPYGADPFHTCPTCTWSQFYGYGRVDLQSALNGPVPIVSSLAPASGTVGTTVTLSGSDFTGATDVSFCAKSAGAPTVLDSAHLTTTVPEGANNGRITVTTPGTGNTGVSTSPFLIVPTLSSTSGKAGDTFTIGGPRLEEATAVRIGGVGAPFCATACTGSPNQLQVTVPPAAGTGTVAVDTPTDDNQPYTTAQTYSVNPTITNVVPPFGNAGTFVGIDGSGFSGVTSVTFNGVPATFTVLAGHLHIDTRVPASATTGTIVVNTVGGSAAWSGGSFSVRPRVTSFVPTRGAVGTLVTIKGSGFRANGATPPAVSFGSTAADPAGVTVVSPNTITALVPAGAASGAITVQTPDGTSPASAVPFVLQPRIVSLSTDHGPVHTVVTVTGTSFTGATAVRFNGAAATTWHVDSDTQITATVPDDATTGLVSVVTAADTAVSATAFRVTPVITDIQPPSGRTGDLVMITGTTFNGATAVSFNGAATTFTVVNPGTIQATVPQSATFGPISVTTPGGTATSTDFSLLPKVLSFAPTSGATGTPVTITGTGFGASVTDVKFNGMSADAGSIVRVSATQVQATVPNGASSGQITVVTSGGSDTSLGNFTVRLSVSNLSPTNGLEGSHVEIDGSGFTSSSVVTFTGPTAAGVDAAPPTVSGDGTTIDAVVPPGALSGPIKVTTGIGAGKISAVGAQSFTVGPVVTGLSVDHGNVGDALTINGRNLAGATEVDFEGIPQTALTVNGAGTTITTTVPANANTGPIAVQTPLFPAQSSPGAFTVVPKLTDFAPASGPVGTSVTLTGTRMSLVSAADVNGTPVTDFTLGGDDSHLIVVVPAGATSGKITVKEPSGLGSTSSGDFTVTSGITDFAPASGTAGDGVVIHGTDLGGATSVTFDGVPATIGGNTATEIDTTVPAGATSGPLVVTTATGPVSAGTFLVPASIASLAPTAGSGGDAVTIHGTGFTNVSDVSFNAVPAAYTAVDGGTITATVPATATTGKVTVTTDAGTATSGADFAVAPVVDSVAPTSALAGTTVTVTGRNLGAVTGVDVGGVPGTAWMISPTQIGLTVPDAAVSGPVGVHTLASGAAVLGPSLTVLPAILGFTPVSANQGDAITIVGSGLKSVVSVGFAGSVSAAPTATAAQSVTVVVPPGAATGPVSLSDGTNTATSGDQLRIGP